MSSSWGRGGHGNGLDTSLSMHVYGAGEGSRLGSGPAAAEELLWRPTVPSTGCPRACAE